MRFTKKIKRLFSLFILTALLLCSCADTALPSDERSFFAMDTLMKVTVWGDDPQKNEEAVSRCVEEISRLEADFSVTLEDSLVSRLNSSGRLEGDTEELAGIISRAQELGEQTGGALNIMMLKISRLWGFTTDTHRVPAEEELEAALEELEDAEISVSPGLVEIRGGQLDFGAVLKGYAADRLYEILKDCGIEHAMCSLGGNVVTVGQKQDGSDWLIAVQDPDDPSRYAGTLSVGEAFVVSSGGYNRYFEEDGGVFHHILDPRSGRPAQSGLASVTIVADSGFKADALSTALFVRGLDEAAGYWRENGDFEAVFIDDDNNIFVTEGLAGSFSSEAGFTVVER